MEEGSGAAFFSKFSFCVLTVSRLYSSRGPAELKNPSVQPHRRADAMPPAFARILHKNPETGRVKTVC
jgi:hypothetical protein